MPGFSAGPVIDTSKQLDNGPWNWVEGLWVLETPHVL
jgi:hypothetical protein